MKFLRYIDDIFIIWTCGLESLNLFISNFNNAHPAIKFSHKISEKSVEFLDVKVTLNCNKLVTSLYKKPTDAPAYLHFASEHPRHIKTSIPYSLALRNQRICSDRLVAQKETLDLFEKFRKRGYPKELLKDAHYKARIATNKLRCRKTSVIQPINLIVTYSRTLPKLNQILRKHYSILENDSSAKNIFSTPPRVVYRRPKNLKSYLVRAKLSHKPSSGKIDGNSAPCGKPRCLCCLQMKNTNLATSSATGFNFLIHGKYNCQSSNVVYLLECSICRKQYIGQTSTKFNIRINNHRSHCKSQDHLAISKHVNETNHKFSDFEFTILKGFFKTDNDRESFESFIIQVFGSVKAGLNEDYGILPNLFSD